MKIKVFIFSSLLFFQAITTVFAVDSFEGFADAFKSEVSEINDISFEFTQKVFVAGATDTVKAEVVYKRPNFFHVRYTEPVRQELYFDGKDLVTYTPRIRQAVARKTDYNDEILGVSVSLIYSSSGLENLENSHRLELKETGNDTISIRAVPRTAREYTEMIIEFDSETLRPLKTAVVSEYASSVTEFENYRINSGVEKERFIFIPPDNVNFIRIEN